MAINRGIQKYKEASASKTSRAKSVKASSSDSNETKKIKLNAEDASVSEAIEVVQEATVKAEEEKELQKEIEEEIATQARHTSKLVRDDFTPVNTPRESLIVEYAPLIRFIAQKIAARLPANIELDDLISSGVIGLMDAIDKYDCSRDNKFKTYAEFRIRGAILDELRAQDWVPRSVREKAKQLERAYAKIEQQKGRQATDDEVCEILGVNQTELNDLITQVRGISLLSVDDIGNLSKADKRSLHGLNEGLGMSSKSGNPLGEITVAHIKKIISDAIGELPEKQRLVLSLYYYEDLNLKEIGRVLDVTESRVSQLHTQAVLKLKARLKNHWDEVGGMI